jgi:pimeloyl-ACP methyl ester carboxylesterase
VVASSLTATYTAMAAGEVDVDRLVLVCPSDSTGSERRAWVRGLLRAPVLGESLFNLMVSEGGIRYFNADHGYYDPASMPDEVVEYEWETAHQPGARFAPASFAAGFLDPEGNIEEALAGLDVPVTLVWGRNSDLSPLEEGRAIAEVGDTELVVFDRAKLLPHAEHPEEFLDVVRDEVAPEP